MFVGWDALLTQTLPNKFCSKLSTYAYCNTRNIGVLLEKAHLQYIAASILHWSSGKSVANNNLHVPCSLCRFLVQSLYLLLLALFPCISGFCSVCQCTHIYAHMEGCLLEIKRGCHWNLHLLMLSKGRPLYVGHYIVLLSMPWCSTTCLCRCTHATTSSV